MILRKTPLRRGHAFAALARDLTLLRGVHRSKAPFRA
jgi:hypothetical protein